MQEPDMQDLLGKFEVHLDPAIPGRFEDMHVLLRVELDGGRVIETRCVFGASTSRRLDAIPGVGPVLATLPDHTY